MVRGPCCEKMGLKKGPWTREEDEILISYIQQHGHGNWRALPKQAGLLRCGKSCRLRWTNYLRPDIKRGNFSKEEEETIIKLHEMLGNRWSAIVARLPGRTDNEIKNVWHTHLKKRLQNYQTTTQVSKRHYPVTKTECDSNAPGQSKQPDSCQTRPNTNMLGHPPVLPQRSSSELSSVTTSSSFVVKEQQTDYSSENLIDKSFWSQALLAEDSGIEQFDSRRELQLEFPILPLLNMENVGTKSSKIDDGMDFWYDIFTRAEELLEF